MMCSVLIGFFNRLFRQENTNTKSLKFLRPFFPHRKAKIAQSSLEEKKKRTHEIIFIC